MHPNCTCPTCGTPFYAKPSVIAHGGKYCSWGCRRPVKPTPASERFWQKVDRNGPTVREELGPCWVWTAHRDTTGYGIFGISARLHAMAHRFAWAEEHGQIPDGLKVLHRCDNPPCVRPDHLFLGTQADNIVDRDRKGRTAWGERQSKAKLTVEAVMEIRRRLADGSSSQAELARMFGVTRPSISQIATGKHWKQIL